MFLVGASGFEPETSCAQGRPKNIDTNYHRKFSNNQTLSAVKAATPMARLGTAEEVADVILFLCSNEARFIQGQAIEVNGGFS
ncbi:MAG: hypothetical protein DMG58_00705 [Acidobacteria bacterium]|nr:MAG: hypothetical protein DMG58_00705 [Acidobacteriota bacterium]PYT38257.1 MAG: hypothetical protein DMG45_24520 [Acidobacteriota bacterium]PYT57481.1 MAG: hypothetical protein DMG46_14085 [Acidobacteriota bacterium]